MGHKSTNKQLFTELFLLRFKPEPTAHQATINFIERKQGSSESVGRYIDEKQILARECKMDNANGIHLTVEGLLPKYKNFINSKNQRIDTYRDLLKLVREVQTVNSEATTSTQCQSCSHVCSSSTTNSNNQDINSIRQSFQDTGIADSTDYPECLATYPQQQVRRPQYQQPFYQQHSYQGITPHHNQYMQASQRFNCPHNSAYEQRPLQHRKFPSNQHRCKSCGEEHARHTCYVFKTKMICKHCKVPGHIRKVCSKLTSQQ